MALVSLIMLGKLFQVLFLGELRDGEVLNLQGILSGWQGQFSSILSYRTHVVNCNGDSFVDDCLS